ncbi:MAG: BON domain-containing protein [Candidatus Cloacimonadaceae bacterium]|nr:BON domain-containing protein [Candidatus Cloacimonadaceae bacterium]
MYHHLRMLLNVLAVSFITVACGQTDTGISTKVKTNLTADETVKAALINVDVQDKIVTLSGSVDTQAVKERAVSVARTTEGVTDVIDKITIQEQGYGSGSEHGREIMGRENREGRDH